MAIDPNTGLNTAPPPVPPGGAASVLGAPGGPQAPPPPTQDQSQPPTIAAPQGPSHAEILGHAIKHVAQTLEGKQTQYVPQPDGTIQEQQVPRKPGGLFRDILLGAIAGGAAASQPAPEGSGRLAGFARGAQGAIQARQAQDSQARNRSLQNADLQKQAGAAKQQQQTADENAAAQIAKSTLTQLDIGHNVGLHANDHVDQYNKAVGIVMKQALANGGSLAPVDGNGEAGNGPALMAAFQKDPTLMQGPEGFHRLPSISYDTTGLTHKDGQWLDKAGKAPDWNARATVSLIDLPNSVWGKNISLSKGDANSVAGRTVAQGKDSDQVQTTFGGIFGLGLKNLDQMNSDRKELYRSPKNENEAKGWQAQVKDIRDRENSSDPEVQKSVTDQEKAFEATKGPMMDAYKFKTQAPTTASIKAETEQLEKKLANYVSTGNATDNLTKDERQTLIQREKKEPVKGVGTDIITQLGPKPVPAQFDKGEEDPAYKALSKKWGQDAVKIAEAKTGWAAEQRMKLLNEGKQVMLIDPATNEAFATDAMTAFQLEQANPRRYITTDKGGQKIYANDAIYREVYNGIDNLRQSYKNIGEYPASVRAKLISAMEDDKDPGGKIQKVMESLQQGTLTPAQNRHVANIQAMMEKAMNVRNLQGTAGSSDTMRNAMVALVPSLLTPTPLAEEKMNQFENTLHQLETGAPTPGRQSKPRQNPAAGGGNPAAGFDASKLKELHSNGKVTIGWDGKNWVDSTTGKPYQQ
jgi:hypothetical protein